MLELRGRTLVVDGREELHVNPAEARDAYLAIVENLIEDGFSLEGDDDDADDDRRVAVFTGHPELERAIDEAPDDPAAYAVFGDYLQTQNDPWGTLMALQLANKPEQAEAFIDKHVHALFGDLANAWRARDVELDWRWGFVRRAKLRWTYGASYTHEELTRNILAHRVTRRLDSIELFRGARSISAVREVPQASRLRELVVRGGGEELELRWIASVMPQLERLELELVQARIAFDHPQLRHLRIWDASLVEVPRGTDRGCPLLTTAELIADRRLPELLEAIATSAPAHVELGLSAVGDAAARAHLDALVASPLASRVRRLSLRFATKPTVAAFGPHAAHLARLEQVRFAGTRPLVRSREAIQAAVPNVRFS